MKPDNKEKDFEECYYNKNSIASANEFTGLIPSSVENETEAESYCEEFGIHEQEKVNFTEESIDPEKDEKDKHK